MPADFRHTAQELFSAFREKQKVARQRLDALNSEQKDFFDKFEDLIGGAVMECAEDIRSAAGGNATVEVTKDSNLEWYQVTITVETVTGPRTASRRFRSNFPRQTVSAQAMDVKGNYSNINGEERIDTFHERERVKSHFNRALYEVLDLPL